MALSIPKTKNESDWSTKQSIIIAIINFAIGTIVFLFAYFSVHYDLGINSVNQPLLAWIIDNRNPQITSIMQIITEITNPYILVALAITISVIWAIKKREIIRPILFITALGISTISFTMVKLITENNRPPADSMILPLEIDFSFPSGHAISIFVGLLILGYLINSRRSSFGKNFIWITVTIIATVLTSASRLYLGYHWATDIIGSIGLGLVILAVIIFIDKFISYKFKSLK